MATVITLKTIVYAILGGALPAVFWLWFWLREEDKNNKEPRGLIALSFITGALVVILALGVERLTSQFMAPGTLRTIAWAAVEEILKYAAVATVVIGSSAIRKPIDYPMYFIAVALGFAALENVLFLLHPIATNGTIVGALTGNLRFLGSTLLHAIASAMIGSAMGLAFYQDWFRRNLYVFIGVISAITLHSLFNLFIMKGSGENFLQVFGFIWIVAIINILIFEKLKRMGGEVDA